MIATPSRTGDYNEPTSIRVGESVIYELSGAKQLQKEKKLSRKERRAKSKVKYKLKRL